MSKQDYYETLEVAKGATVEEIKKSYRRLAMKYHPDRNQGNAEAEAKFKEINEAYEILKDDQKRVSIGARPVRAETLTLDLSEKADMEHLVKKVQEQFSFGSNRRGSADYRRHIAGVLVKRACAANEQQEDRK